MFCARFGCNWQRSFRKKRLLSCKFNISHSILGKPLSIHLSNLNDALYQISLKLHCGVFGEQQVIKVALTSAKTESNYPDDFDTQMLSLNCITLPFMLMKYVNTKKQEQI